MVLTSKAQPNLVGGVSQQPDALRLDSQCRVQENAYGTVVEGLKKRFPTKWLGDVTGGANDQLDIANYHWVNRDANERYLLAVVNNTNTGPQIRAWDINGVAQPVHYPVPATVSNYLSYNLITDFKWTTVNDYTFLTNRSKIVTFGTPSAAQDKRKGYVYIRVPGYKTNYSISATAASGPALNVSLSTWDGTTAAPVQEEWTVNFTSTTGGTGSVTVLGYTRNFGIAGTTTTAANLSAAVNAAGAGDSMDDVVSALYTSGQSSMRIRGDFAGLSFTPTVTAPGCTFTVTQTVNTGPGTEYNSIKTDDIAAELVTRINAVGSGWAASASGSVIEITHATQDILTITTKDSVGDTAMKPYFLTVDNFDELPPRCRDGIVLKVQGSVESFEDDFYVKFVTKVAGSFDEGEWRETVAPQVNTKLNNVPIVIVRRVDDAGGTITGTPFLPYFSVESFNWSDRLVGDDNSNPAPTFVGSPINDVFFHKNRLGMLTDSSIVLSEAGIYGNFFRTSTRQLLDGDPIDLQAAHTSVSKLEHAVPHNERLLVFAEKAQFVLDGQPLLTPKTASFQFVSYFDSDLGQTPVAVNRNIYFAANKGGYGALWEYQQILENTTVGAYSATELTSQVPRYIPANIRDITASPNDEVFFIRSPNEKNALYVWKYFINGQQVLQSAWSKFTFQFDILSMGLYDNSLYMVTNLRNGNGTLTTSFGVQKFDIKFGTESFDPVTEPLIDCQWAIQPVDMILSGGNTRITVPTGYIYPTGTSPVVVKPDGTILTTTKINDSVAEVAGNQTAVTGMIFGFPYTMRYQFGRVDVREETQRGGYATVKAGRYQNLFGLLKYSKTNNFTVTTKIQNEATNSMTFTASIGNDGGGPVKLDNGEYRFPTLTKTDNLTVEILNSTPFPCTILGAEWIANFTTNFVRLRQ